LNSLKENSVSNWLANLKSGASEPTAIINTSKELFEKVLKTT
jgi:hypothetical protein